MIASLGSSDDVVVDDGRDGWRSKARLPAIYLISSRMMMGDVLAVVDDDDCNIVVVYRLLALFNCIVHCFLEQLLRT